MKKQLIQILMIGSLMCGFVHAGLADAEKSLQEAIKQYDQAYKEEQEKQLQKYIQQQDTLEVLIQIIMQNNEEAFNNFFQEHTGFDVNYVDLLGFTPLHYAAALLNTYAVKALVEKGADVNAPSGFGDITPLDGAVANRLWNRIVIKNGQSCEIDKAKSSVRFSATRCDGREVIFWTDTTDEQATEKSTPARDEIIAFLKEKGAIPLFGLVGNSCDFGSGIEEQIDQIFSDFAQDFFLF